MGIRDLKEHISTKVLKGIFVITDHGKPVSVNLPYSDVMELLDILDELTDPETIEIVARGRKSIKKGMKGVSAASLFRKIRAGQE